MDLMVGCSVQCVDPCDTRLDGMTGEVIKAGTDGWFWIRLDRKVYKESNKPEILVTQGDAWRPVT